MFIPLSVQAGYLLRIFIALLCGGVIGYERESRLKTAGIRTHLIVSLASALMMILSKYGFGDVLALSSIDLDPSRIAAGVVTAIGFLGAGVIFVHKQTISGLTTAAGIWATVGVGMAIGAGLYLIGIAVTVLLIIVQILLHRNIKWIKKAVIEQISLHISDDEDSIPDIVQKITARGIELISMKARRVPSGGFDVKLLVRFPDTYRLADIMSMLREDCNIDSIDI